MIPPCGGPRGGPIEGWDARSRSRETAAHCERQIVVDGRRHSGEAEGLDGATGQAGEERRLRRRDVTVDLPCGEAVHSGAHDTPGAGPQLVAEFGAHTSGQQQLPRREVRVDGTFGGGQNLRDLLPLVDQHRPGSTAQRRIGVRAIGRRNAGLVKPLNAGHPLRLAVVVFSSAPVIITAGKSANRSSR